MYCLYLRFKIAWTSPSTFPSTFLFLVVSNPQKPIAFIISCSSGVLPSRSASDTAGRSATPLESASRLDRDDVGFALSLSNDLDLIESNHKPRLMQWELEEEKTRTRVHGQGNGTHPRRTHISKDHCSVWIDRVGKKGDRFTNTLHAIIHLERRFRSRSRLLSLDLWRRSRFLSLSTDLSPRRSRSRSLERFRARCSRSRTFSRRRDVDGDGDLPIIGTVAFWKVEKIEFVAHGQTKLTQFRQHRRSSVSNAGNEESGPKISMQTYISDETEQT